MKTLTITLMFCSILACSHIGNTRDLKLKNDSTKNQLKMNDSFVFEVDSNFSNTKFINYTNDETYINKNWDCSILDSSYKFSKIIKYVQLGSKLPVYCAYIETKSAPSRDTLIFCKEIIANEYPEYCVKVNFQGKTALIMYYNDNLTAFIKNNFKFFLQLQ